MLEIFFQWVLRRRVFLGGIGLVLCLRLARPITHPVWYGVAASLTLFGVVLRAWASGIIVKGRILATTGPYTWFRHPLYVGSLGIALGTSLATGQIWLVIPLNLGFVLVYGGLMTREENLLRERFGEAGERFIASRGRWFPRGGNAWDPTPWSARRMLREHHEWQAWLGLLAYGLLLAARLRGWPIH